MEFKIEIVEVRGNEFWRYFVDGERVTEEEFNSLKESDDEEFGEPCECESCEIIRDVLEQIYESDCEECDFELLRDLIDDVVGDTYEDAYEDGFQDGISHCLRQSAEIMSQIADEIDEDIED